MPYGPTVLLQKSPSRVLLQQGLLVPTPTSPPNTFFFKNFPGIVCKDIFYLPTAAMCRTRTLRRGTEGVYIYLPPPRAKPCVNSLTTPACYTHSISSRCPSPPLLTSRKTFLTHSWAHNTSKTFSDSATSTPPTQLPPSSPHEHSPISL
ncbi:hypothetical protein BS50DRAFT_292890 [Corynespora cassiicola Philippines]|uniref:Uncharacterized protein n=1 Tax=Corynespora cassiicola Philippines TaxID=1448308 RepID=A0A2T2NW84_CORCC|nr:hypothetical protein BS50DRAFT_292890 [Corynespora cassiicola Philippines]